MKEILLSSTAQHDLVGELFFKKEVLNTMQLNSIKKEMIKPSFDYKVDTDSAWALYNHITLALKDSHPSTWMEDQLKVHEVFSNMLDLEPEVDIADVVEEHEVVETIDDVLNEIEYEDSRIA